MVVEDWELSDSEDEEPRSAENNRAVKLKDDWDVVEDDDDNPADHTSNSEEDDWSAVRAEISSVTLPIFRGYSVCGVNAYADYVSFAPGELRGLGGGMKSAGSQTTTQNSQNQEKYWVSAAGLKKAIARTLLKSAGRGKAAAGANAGAASSSEEKFVDRVRLRRFGLSVGGGDGAGVGLDAVEGLNAERNRTRAKEAAVAERQKAATGRERCPAGAVCSAVWHVCSMWGGARQCAVYLSWRVPLPFAFGM